MADKKKEVIKKPTKAALIKELSSTFGLEVDKIEDEVYEKAIKGYDRGLKIRTMAARCRFHIVGGARDADKEKINMRGIFVGSRDLTTEKKPLGKNKVQILSFLREGEDGSLELMTDPSVPTHFKGFKKDNFGALIESDFVITKDSDRTFATPGNVVAIDKNYAIDTSKINVITVPQAFALEDYTECAIVGTVSGIYQLRVPEWDSDKYDDEDFPIIVNGNPVCQLYLEREDEEPILRASISPTNIARPFIAVDDFEEIWIEGADAEEDLAPSFSGRKVILIGQKRKNSEYDGKDYIDFNINGIIEVTGEPIVSTKAVKASKSKPTTDKPADKDAAKAKKAKQMKVRTKLVGESVTALREETTVEVVKNMHDEKYFKNVSDEAIQEMITQEFEKQDISVEPEPEPEPEQEQEPETEPEEESKEPEAKEDSEEDWD